MLNIIDSAAVARALDSPLDGRIKAFLVLRADQLSEHIDTDLGELAHWIVVEPGDGVSELETAAGYPIITKPAFEWVLDHGGFYELPTILSDDGFGVVLIIPEREGVDPDLLKLCRQVP
jgi:hypothetical protein